MSRIGKKPILIPSGVSADIKGAEVKVQGPKGEMTLILRPEISAAVKEGNIILEIKKDAKSTNANAFWGLDRALVANMVTGVTAGFEKKLELVGVGYRVKQNGTALTLTVGFSHPVEVPAPEGITLTAVDATNITIAGSNKQQVGLIAAQIRKIRKPEPYKGKGIKYQNEVVKRKAGKSAKTAA
jgi:large subunit ribosomal protein L6